jgi:hypothetical protein
MWLGAQLVETSTNCSTRWLTKRACREQSRSWSKADGARWIWDVVAEHFPGTVQIVDLYPAYEHVWQVAHAVFGRGTPQAAAWAEVACDLLIQGQIEQLVAEISKLPPIAPPPGKTKSIRRRKPLATLPPMLSACGIRLFALKACTWAVALPKLLARLSFPLVGTAIWYALDALSGLMPSFDCRTAKLNRTLDDFWDSQSQLIA